MGIVETEPSGDGMSSRRGLAEGSTVETLLVPTCRDGPASACEDVNFSRLGLLWCPDSCLSPHVILPNSGCFHSLSGG